MSIDRDAVATLDWTGIDSGDVISPVTPGSVLRHEFLDPMGLTPYGLAKAIEMPVNRVTGILHGTRGVTADTALRFAAYFGTSAEFWMNLQTGYDLQVARMAMA